MLIRLFFWIFIKHLLCFVGGSHAALLLMVGPAAPAAAAAEPYVLPVSLGLAILATVIDTMDKYCDELSSMQEHLQSVKAKLEQDGKTLALN